MEKTYQPENIERQWYENWESKGYFRPSGEGDSYSIAIPPPTVPPPDPQTVPPPDHMVP